MPNRRDYPTENWKFDNCREVLWEKGLFKTSDSPNLMVHFLCSARNILGKDCPQKGHVNAASVLRKGREYRALHPECHRKIKGLLVVRATFPDEDMTLKPGGSEVQWTKAHRIEVEENGRVERRRWYVPVICGGCRAPRDVAVRRGLTEERELTVGDLALDAGATGECALYCRNCWLKYFRRDLKLPDGSEILFSEWDKPGLPAICGKCQTRQHLDCHTSGADLDVYDWPCMNCGHLLGGEDHPSGAKILWLDRKASSGKSQFAEKHPNWKPLVGFICAACGERHYAHAHNTQCRTWRGRAEACKRAAGDPKWIGADRKSEVSDTWARFSTEKEGMVTIEYDKCPHRPKIPHSQAVDNYKTLLAICPECRRRAIREALSMVKAGGLSALVKSQSGNGQKNGGSKKRGPVKGQYA